MQFKRKRIRKRQAQCHCCKEIVPFAWLCNCGFTICQTCFKENEWGMTCSGISWECPDCGHSNGLGNQ